MRMEPGPGAAPTPGQQGLQSSCAPRGLSDYFPLRFFASTLEREKGHKDRPAGGCALIRTLFKWGIPMFLNGLSIFIGMIMLHMGTYYYVHQMRQTVGVFDRRDVPETNFSVPLSMGWRSRGDLLSEDGDPKALSFGSLNDPIEQLAGYEAVDIHFLDKVAACFPLLFGLLAVGMDELPTWSRIMFCNACLALGKGFFGMCTTVPDSKGWEECRNRLGAPGLGWMSQVHGWQDFVEMELFGVDGQHLRWCADMMFSGHTYFTTLYALGLYELVFIFTREWNKPLRWLALVVVTLLTVGEQVVEVYFVLLNRFHYTMDVAMAILLTFLFYTNSVVAEVTKRWVWFGCARVANARWNPDQVKQVHQVRYELLLQDKLPIDCAFIQAKELQADADVVIPPCCNPCCCCFPKKFMTVRHHSYDDEDLGDMLFSLAPDQQRDIADHMRLSVRHDVEDNRNWMASDGLPKHMRSNLTDSPTAALLQGSP